MDDRQRAVVIAPARLLCDALSGEAGRAPLGPPALRPDPCRDQAPGRPPARSRESPRPCGCWDRPSQRYPLPNAGPWWPTSAQRPLTTGCAAGPDQRHRRIDGQSRHHSCALLPVCPAGADPRPARRQGFPRQAFPAIKRSTAAGGIEAALRIEELVRLSRPRSPVPACRQAFRPATATGPSTASVQELITAGNLRYVNGNRLDESGFNPKEGKRSLAGGTAGAPRRGTAVHQPPELHRPCPNGRLTEPGDVVFCTSPRPAARVDMRAAPSSSSLPGS
jgi:hypothetical protein